MSDVAAWPARPPRRWPLGVVAVRVDMPPSGEPAPPRTRSRAGRAHRREVIVDADAAEIPVGIDGETVMLPDAGPLHHPATGAPGPSCRGNVPAFRARKPALEWPRLRQLASFRPQPDRVPLPAQPAAAKPTSTGQEPGP